VLYVWDWNLGCPQDRLSVLRENTPRKNILPPEIELGTSSYRASIPKNSNNWTYEAISQMFHETVHGGKIAVGEKIRKTIKCSADRLAARLPERII
jgi:hypothetical protein